MPECDKASRRGRSLSSAAPSFRPVPRNVCLMRPVVTRPSVTHWYTLGSTVNGARSKPSSASPRTSGPTPKEQSLISLTKRGGVGVLTLERPPVNAINAELMDELYAVHDDIVAQPDIRVVVVRSTQRFFSPGVDINMISGFLEEENGSETMLAFIRRIQGFYTKWHRLPLPTIAAIEGTATGGGLEFALACDLRVASHDIRVGLPEVKIGLLPGAGGTQRLTRVAGIATATRLILTGELVSGIEAERLGIVHKAVSRDQVEPQAFAWAESLAQFPASSLAEIKSCLSVAPSDAGFAAEVDGSARLLAAPDSQKMVNAFLARRNGRRTTVTTGRGAS